MITAVIILTGFLAWALASRALHEGESCHPRGKPESHAVVAAWAITAALLWPVTLFITPRSWRDPPTGRRELEEKTRMLEAENTRLRRDQEGKS